MGHYRTNFSSKDNTVGTNLLSHFVYSLMINYQIFALVLARVELHLYRLNNLPAESTSTSYQEFEEMQVHRLRTVYGESGL